MRVKSSYRNFEENSRLVKSCSMINMTKLYFPLSGNTERKSNFSCFLFVSCRLLMSFFHLLCAFRIPLLHFCFSHNCNSQSMNTVHLVHLLTYSQQVSIVSLGQQVHSSLSSWVFSVS